MFSQEGSNNESIPSQTIPRFVSHGVSFLEHSLQCNTECACVNCLCRGATQSSSGCIVEGGLLTQAMEAHYCDCIIESGLLTHAHIAVAVL